MGTWGEPLLERDGGGLRRCDRRPPTAGDGPGSADSKILTLPCLACTLPTPRNGGLSDCLVEMERRGEIRGARDGKSEQVSTVVTPAPKPKTLADLGITRDQSASFLAWYDSAQ